MTLRVQFFLVGQAGVGWGIFLLLLLFPSLYFSLLLFFVQVPPILSGPIESAAFFKGVFVFFSRYHNMETSFSTAQIVRMCSEQFVHLLVHNTCALLLLVLSRGDGNDPPLLPGILVEDQVNLSC